MRHATKALRCNGFVAGPNSAGSFYVLSYHTLLLKTCSKCPAREIHSPSCFTVNIGLSMNCNTKSYLSSVRNLKQRIKLSFLLHKRIELSLLADCSILHDKDFIIAAKNRFL